MGDYRTTTGQAPPLSPRDQSRRVRRWLAMAALLLVVLVAAALLIKVHSLVPASGYITTEEYAEVRPAVQAAVAEIVAHSGDIVEAGDVLVRMEDAEQLASRDEARSRLGRIEAQLARRVAEVAEECRQRENQIGISRLRLEYASATLELTQELSAKGLAAGRAIEDAKLREQLAKAELDALLSRDQTLPQKELDVLHREVEAASDALQRAEAQLRQRRVCAPINGKVQRYGFVVGELVKPDTVLYEIFGGERQILKLRLAERFAMMVHSGQSYRAALLPLRGRHRVWFSGHVERMRDVIEAENQITYRVVYCDFSTDDYEIPPGTTAEAWIEVGRVPLWVRLFGLY